jgi:DNA-binding Xre family transcriptional regulator
MAISYNRLWKLMIDKNMKKREMQEACGFSSSVITKLNNNKSVTVATLSRICSLLNCKVEDIMEITQDDKEKTSNG